MTGRKQTDQLSLARDLESSAGLKVFAGDLAKKAGSFSENF